MEQQTFTIKYQEVLKFGRNTFIKDVEHFLKGFSQEEQIEIAETLIKIVKNFINKNGYEDAYEIYKNDFLKKYLWRTANADQKRILDYFTYAGLEWKYANSLFKESQSTYIETEEYKESEVNEQFEGSLKYFLKDLKLHLHMLLVYKFDSSTDDFKYSNPNLTSPFEPNPTPQKVLALYYYYAQMSKDIEHFEKMAETKEKAYAMIGKKHSVSAKNFEIKYNLISTSKQERLKNKKYLEKAIELLEDFPNAKKLAEAELKECK